MKKLFTILLLSISLSASAQIIQTPAGVGMGPGFDSLRPSTGWDVSSGNFRRGLIREFLPENTVRFGASQAVIIPNSAVSTQEFIGGGLGYSYAKALYVNNGGIGCGAAHTSPIYAKDVTTNPKTFAVSFQAPGYVWNMEYPLANNATFSSSTLFAYFLHPVSNLLLYWANSPVSQFKSGWYGFTPNQKHTALVSYDPGSKEFIMVTDYGVSASGTYTGANYDKYIADFDQIIFGYNVGNPCYIHGAWWWDRALTFKEARSAVRAIQNKGVWTPSTFVASSAITTADSFFRTGLECEYTPASYSSYATGAYEFINVIYDSSGNGHHATQTIETSMPTATTSAIFFDDINASVAMPAMERCKTFAIRLQFTQTNTDNGIYKSISNGLITYPTNAFYWYHATSGSPADNTYHQIYANSALNGRDVVLMGTLDETRKISYMFTDDYFAPRYFGTNTVNFAPKYLGYMPALYGGFVGKFKGFWGWTKTFTPNEMKLLEGAIQAL